MFQGSLARLSSAPQNRHLKGKKRQAGAAITLEVSLGDEASNNDG
jgi:hypothetical protein